MKCKKALALLLAAVLTAGIPAGCASSASSGSERRLGSFQAVTLDGGTFTQADIAGKDVTIINFWGTFCAPCIAEMPDLAGTFLAAVNEALKAGGKAEISLEQ